MVVANLHEVCVKGFYIHTFLTPKSVEEVLETVFSRGFRAEDVDWIRSQQVTLGGDDPHKAHEISKFL